MREPSIPYRLIEEDPHRHARARMHEADVTGDYGHLAAVGQHPPNDDVRATARDYMQTHGIAIDPHAEGEYEPLDENKAKRVADAFEDSKHQPSDPDTHASYEAFKKETLDQYDHLTKHGYKMIPWADKGQPYADSKGFIDDVRQNKQIKYFKTINPDEPSFGQDKGGDPKDNPLLESAHRPTKDTKGNDHDQTYNDIFRAVHDIYGHTKEGNQTGPRGEENAWRQHSRMYSPLARRAMTTETRGQNSWVNFGRHLRRGDGSLPKRGEPDFVPLPKRPYAHQKVTVLPKEFSEFQPESLPRAAGLGLVLVEAAVGGSMNETATATMNRTANYEKMRGYLVAKGADPALFESGSSRLANGIPVEDFADFSAEDLWMYRRALEATIETPDPLIDVTAAISEYNEVLDTFIDRGIQSEDEVTKELYEFVSKVAQFPEEMMDLPPSAIEMICPICKHDLNDHGIPEHGAIAGGCADCSDCMAGMKPEESRPLGPELDVAPMDWVTGAKTAYKSGMSKEELIDHLRGDHDIVDQTLLDFDEMTQQDLDDYHGIDHDNPYEIEPNPDEHPTPHDHPGLDRIGSKTSEKMPHQNPVNPAPTAEDLRRHIKEQHGKEPKEHWGEMYRQHLDIHNEED